MGSIIAIWRARIAVLLAGSEQALADALAGTGPKRLLALVTIPLWLTPDLYNRHLRPGAARSGRSVLWLAAWLWLGTMTLVSYPAIPLLQRTVADIGTRLGYWDELFTGRTIGFLIPAAVSLMFLALAAFDWLQTWSACLIDTAFGGRTISPPPFGYFATRIAGDLAGLAAVASALFFAARPVNAPVWRWLDSTYLLKPILIAGLLAAVVTVSGRKTRVAQVRARETYGGIGRALAYQSGHLLVTAAGVWLLTLHMRR